MAPARRYELSCFPMTQSAVISLACKIVTRLYLQVYAGQSGGPHRHPLRARQLAMALCRATRFTQHSRESSCTRSRTHETP